MNGGVYHYKCTVCGGTGKPGEEQLHKAMLEEANLCTSCEASMLDHPTSSPYGCILALAKEVRRLKGLLEAHLSES